jgi:hypothetical protein
VLVPQIAYTVTQYHVTRLPVSTIYGLMGLLNAATFRGAPPGYAMYLGARAQRKVVGNFSNVWYFDWTVVHKFMVGKRDLRKELNPGTGVYTNITDSGGNSKVEVGDFTALGLGESYF